MTTLHDVMSMFSFVQFHVMLNMFDVSGNGRMHAPFLCIPVPGCRPQSCGGAEAEVWCFIQFEFHE